MKLVTINPDYRGSFFDDGGQELFDIFFNDSLLTVHAFDSGEAMILPGTVAELFKEIAEKIDSFHNETSPIIFEVYDPGGEHKTLDEIRKAAR